MKSSQTIQKFRKLMAEGKQEAAFNLITEDASWCVDEIIAPLSRVFNCRESIVEPFTQISGTTRNFKRTIEKTIEDDE